jgi:hypothetical protein
MTANVVQCAGLTRSVTFCLSLELKLESEFNKLFDLFFYVIVGSGSKDALGSGFNRV